MLERNSVYQYFPFQVCLSKVEKSYQQSWQIVLWENCITVKCQLGTNLLLRT